MSIKIISDSACDMPKELVEKYNIDIVPFHVTYGDDNYFKDYYDKSNEEFYTTLRNEVCTPKTSMPTPDAYMEYFKPYAEKGDDIICICLSSKLSGSYGGASIAVDMVKDEYSIKIAAVDTLGACMMQGYIAIEAAKMVEAGKSFEEIMEVIKIMIPNQGAVLTVDSLVYLQRGGRIGKASAIAGDLLNIKPIILVKDGELFPHSKVRTRSKAQDKLIESVLEMTQGLDQSKVRYFAIYSCPTAEAKDLGDKFKAKTGTEFVGLYYMGATVGAHVGPTALGIGYSTSY